MKKLITLLFSIALLVGITGCKKEKTESLHIGLMKSLLSVPYYYAQEQGIFEKYGVDVKLELYNSAKDRDAAFKGNKINGVSTDLVAALLYLNSGKDIVITSQTEEKFRLVTRKDYGVTSVEDIQKAKIGLSENTVIDYLVDYVMKENNITLVEQNNIDENNQDKVYARIPIPVVPDRFSLLKEGKIDMAIIPEPFPSLMIAEGGVELWNNIDEDLYVTCFVVDKNFAESNYEMIKNMNLALNEAIKEMMEGSYEDYKHIITDPAHVLIPEKSLGIVEQQVFHPLKNPSQDTFEDVLAWCKEKNIISKDYQLKEILFPYQLEDQ
ncbi:ABC transporter substrate-binding protein [Mycoplasmatota bacterium]|nr:ABC transporter substrate-binding protein [Mycoplasmatota bacterium]